MDEKMIASIISSLEKCEGKERQRIIADYVYETFDEDEIVSLPAEFFAELLKVEKDVICKWYEIKAIGQWKAVEYSDLLLDVIMQDDVTIDRSSLHLIASGALGKMGGAVVAKLKESWGDANDASRIAIIDALGESRSLEAVNALKELIYSLSDKEFLYATLALSKCKQEGSAVLKEIYNESSDYRKIYIVDALARDRANDDFLVSLVSINLEVMLGALKLQTRGIDDLKKRMLIEEDGWSKSVIDILRKNGVHIDE